MQLALPHLAVADGSQLVQAPLEPTGSFTIASLGLLDARSILAVIWFVGFLFFLTRRAVGSFQLWKLKRESISPPVRILTLAREIAGAYQLRRPAEIILSEGRTVPLTWGTIRPVIMLPIEAVEWDEEMLRIVLRHEYAHIRRFDSCCRVVAQLAFALHWMNPLVWSAVRKLRLNQEQAADDLVLEAGVDPALYADELVATVRRFLQPASALEQTLAMAQPSTLKTRVEAVLDNERDRRPAGRGLLLGSILASLLILAGSSLAQVTGAPEAPAEASPGNNGVEVQQPAAPHSAPTKKPEFGKHPINITAEDTKFENEIAIATGAATLTYLNTKISADTIHYSPVTRTAIAKGNVDITVENGNRLTGVDATVEYNLETDALKVSGKHKVIMKKPEGPK
ncbi:MAG: hypothetical protein EOP84_27295 [Verrucomicrobiaceae bacterium]|nr:MAG: hypothetical protein EOP84_27295 [Verrucomicrobiaceae bacterium]